MPRYSSIHGDGENSESASPGVCIVASDDIGYRRGGAPVNAIGSESMRSHSLR
jgi:hypothetical protein